MSILTSIVESQIDAVAPRCAEQLGAGLEAGS